MFRIVESNFVKSAVKPQGFPHSEYPDIAFAGKSNVGKSSMINTLLNRKAIAKISSTPGKTRLINFFEVRYKDNCPEQSKYLNFVDLPGYGYARVSKQERESWRRMVDGYFINRQQIKGVIVLVDIRHKADPKDNLMLAMLGSRKIPFIVVATKSDKIPGSKIPATLKKLAEQHTIERQLIKPYSSLKKSGISSVLDWIQRQIQ